MGVNSLASQLVPRQPLLKRRSGRERTQRSQCNARAYARGSAKRSNCSEPTRAGARPRDAIGSRRGGDRLSERSHDALMRGLPRCRTGKSLRRKCRLPPIADGISGAVIAKEAAKCDHDVQREWDQQQWQGRYNPTGLALPERQKCAQRRCKQANDDEER